MTRRGFIRRVLLALVAVPLARLGETVARGERRRRHHRGADPDSFWIGHC